MGELTNDKKTLLRATSRIRGITLDTILKLGLYRPKITLQSLLSTGWLEHAYLRTDRPPHYFLTDRAVRWLDVYSDKTL